MATRPDRAIADVDRADETRADETRADVNSTECTDLNSTDSAMFDVIVVGGGIAGLACADSLVNAGRRVPVCQGRVRPVMVLSCSFRA
jgi:ribulose 1,5-bisphosphate synthetase/thiazole synthase